MINISSELAPLTTDPDLRAHLDRMFAEVRESLSVISALTMAGYAGLGLITPVDIPDITNSWYTVDVFDKEIFINPVRIAQRLPSALVFNKTGVYSVTIGLSIHHNEQNDGRTMNVRLWSPAVGEGTQLVPVATGGNSEATSFSFTTYFQVQPNHVGVDFEIQLQRDLGLDYLNVSIVSAVFLSNSIGGLPDE